MNLKTFATVCALSVFFLTSGLTNSKGQSDPDMKSLIKSAEQGDAIAQRNLALMYYQGKGVNKNLTEALIWSSKAAAQGDMEAQGTLGSIYVEGLVVMQDYIKAYMWLTLSTAGSKDKQSSSYKKFADLRESIAKKMTPQQIQEAKQLAKEWKSPRRSSPSRLIRKVDPVYPLSAMYERVSGNVRLIITIDEKGSVSNIRISSGHPLLNEAAINAVKQWKYAPALLNGVPVPVTATVTVHFNLK